MHSLVLHCDKILKTDWSNATQLTQRSYPHVTLYLTMLKEAYIMFKTQHIDATQRNTRLASLCEPALINTIASLSCIYYPIIHVHVYTCRNILKSLVHVHVAK